MKSFPLKIRLVMALLTLILGNALAQSPEKNPQNTVKPSSGANASANSYLSIQQSGQLLFLSGKGPLTAEGNYIRGKIGAQLTLAAGIQAAKLVAANHLAALKEWLGDLDNIKQIIKVNGYINATDDFSGHSLVMNGFSDALIAELGSRGKHARTSVGVASLPEQMALEVEMIIEVYPKTKNSTH